MTRDLGSGGGFNLDLDVESWDEQPPRRHVSPGKVALSTQMYSALAVQHPEREQPPIMRKPEVGAAAELGAMDRAFQAGRARVDPDGALARAAGSAGSLLPDDLRTSMERSLGADLGGVRVHTGAESSDAAKAVGAKAYATGQDIHFAAGNYDPESKAGQYLIAHEVAHTVQQGSGGGTVQGKLEVSGPGDAPEREADRFANAFLAGEAPRDVPRLGHLVPYGSLQRKPDAGPPAPSAELPAARHLGPDTLVAKGFEWIDRVFEVRFPAFRAAVDHLDSSTATSIEVRILRDTRRAEACAERAAAEVDPRGGQVRWPAGPAQSGPRPSSAPSDDPSLRRLHRKLATARLELAPRLGPRFFRGECIGPPAAPAAARASDALAGAALRTIALLHSIERVKAQLGDRPEEANRLDKSFAAHVAMEAGNDPEDARFVFHVLEEAKLGTILGNKSEKFGRGYAKAKAEAFDTGPIPTTVAGVFARLEQGKQAFLAEEYATAEGILRSVRIALKQFASADNYSRARRQPGSSATALGIAQGAPLVIDRLLIRVRQKAGGPGRAGLWDSDVASLEGVREALELMAQETSTEDPKCYTPAVVDTYVDATPLIKRFAREQIDNHLRAEGRTFFDHTQAFEDAYYAAFEEVYGLVMTPNGPITEAEKRKRSDEESKKAAGFADTKRLQIHIDLDKNLPVDVVIHELMHLYEKPPGLRLGKVGREGAADYFTRAICRQNRIEFDIGYPVEVMAIEGLVEEVGEYVVATAYFQGNTALLQQALDAKAPGTFQRYRSLLAVKNWEAALEEIRGAGRSVGQAHEAKTKREEEEARRRQQQETGAREQRLIQERNSWPEEGDAPVSGRVVHIVGLGGSRTRLVINRGGAHGIREGWRGPLRDEEGRAVPGGALKVTKVYTDRCEGIVNLRRSAVPTTSLAVELQPRGGE